MKNGKSLCFGILALSTRLAAGEPVIEIPQYHVGEIGFEGSYYSEIDNPVSEIEIRTTWVHESGYPTFELFGYFDGNGNGNAAGNKFKVRFCPTQPGTWKLVRTRSNDPLLERQKEGLTVRSAPSSHPGFWIADATSADGRWYRRSDGSHPYIVGNTFYTFLSGYGSEGVISNDPVEDIANASHYFNKIRFGITGDLFPDPDAKPFLDQAGKPTDNGDFSHRPNPKWFQTKVDAAVRAAFERDAIADIILNGPDSENGRSNLRAAANSGDCSPFLKYIAARYGSFPNAWICLSNEYEIRSPNYTDQEISLLGEKMKDYLPYPTHLSVHGFQRDWRPGVNTTPRWNDHAILQNKLKSLPSAAEFAMRNYWIAGPGLPVINDELAYQGNGDGWSKEDVVEAFLGAFMGGSYASSGYKSGHKLGHYFSGDFDANEHTAAFALNWMRQEIEANLSFWEMHPCLLSYAADGATSSIFANLSDSFRAMEWKNNEYVLGTNGSRSGVRAKLPPRKWKVVIYDLIAMSSEEIATETTGVFTFDTPNSRACLMHFSRSEKPHSVVQ